MINILNKISGTLIFLLGSLTLFAQSGKLEGLIHEGEELEPVLFATIHIPNTGIGTTSDLDGNYSINLDPGIYQMEFSAIGYESRLMENIEIKSGETTRLDVKLAVLSEELNEVQVLVSPLSRKEKSSVSLRGLRSNEIKYGAGSSGDISLLVQGMPGVTFPPGHSNAINIRGGSSFENKFFVDDIEIPMLNHFAKQGSSGGARSILNMDLLKSVDVYTSAFPADKGNALSGILDFKISDGNRNQLSGSFQAGVIDFAAALNGPLGDNINFNVSLRHSYTGWVLGLLGQPFIASYDDWNYKLKWNLAENHQLTFIGLGAYDVGQGNENYKRTPINEFIMDQLRNSTQWNTVNGVKYTNFRGQHFTHVILTHYLLEENSERYLFRDDSNPSNLLEDYSSREGELRLTLKNTQRYNDFKIAFGGEIGRIGYDTDAFFNVNINGQSAPLSYNSDIQFNKWGAYAQVSQRLFDRFMLVTLGARVDANDFSSSMNNPLQQFSPRFSVSYAINEKVTFNLNAGQYYQMPSGLTLSFRDADNNLVNQSDNVKYMSANHIVGGVEWVHPILKSKISLEGYYKKYNDYPFSVADEVALLNKDIDLFRAVSEPVVSIGEGESYGIELLVEQKKSRDFYGRFSYSLAWAQFRNGNKIYQPSLFDIRHAASLSGGKHFDEGWHVGVKLAYQSPKPFTPFDFEKSSLISSWRGAQAFNILDYSLLNTGRMDPIFEVNIRVDKKFSYLKWEWEVFIDVLNIFDFRPAESPVVAIRKDGDGNPLIDPNNPAAYQTFWVPREVSTLFPSMGVIARF